MQNPISIEFLIITTTAKRKKRIVAENKELRFKLNQKQSLFKIQ
jgi:hypothetical protein